jgi:methylated-DNA-[protein]-cysteine S-methyltransferase
MSAVQYLMKSKITPLYLIASDEGLEGIFFEKQKIPLVKTLAADQKSSEILKQTQFQLEEYFAGKRTEFDLPLKFSGTPFQKKVWNQLSKIPYGKTCAYREVAKKIKNEKAVRAVGSANGKNPFCIVIPCHRVIAADGTLGGYAGGLEIKSKLLELEGV